MRKLEEIERCLIFFEDLIPRIQNKLRLGIITMCSDDIQPDTVVTKMEEQAA